MRQSACITAAVLTVVAFFTTDARAQGPAGAPPPPPPGGQIQPGPAGGPNGAQAAGEDKEEQGRLRIGFNGNIGVGTGGGFSGLAVGGTFRIGWQLDRLMGIYGQVSPMAWLAVNSNVSGAGVAAIAGYQFTPMFSLTPADILELAAGPSLDYLSGGTAGGSVSGTTGTASASAFSSVYFAAHGRIALHFGSRNEETGRRRGFTLGGDIHPTFVSGGPVTFITLGLGYDWL